MVMPTRQTRRWFLSAMATGAAVIRAPSSLSAEEALEKTTVRLPKGAGITTPNGQMVRTGLAAGGRWVTFSTAVRKAGDFWSIPGIWACLTPARIWQSPAHPDEMRPAEWNGTANQGSGAVWSRCFFRFEMHQ
jgi:hypothetical protein